MNIYSYMEEEFAHFNVRCSIELRDNVEKLAKKQGQSLAEWVRRAMQEKLERDSGSINVPNIDKNDLRVLVEEIMSERDKDKRNQ